MNPDQIAGVVRHLATLFGGFLIAKLNIPAEYIESIVGGLAALAAVVWSITSKRPLPAPAPKPGP
jgi:hypothetical protein